MMDRRIKSYAVQITWDDGGTEIREDFPPFPDIEEWMDEIELEENKAYNMIEENNDENLEIDIDGGLSEINEQENQDEKNND
jgi:hypothetical protein